MARKYYERDIKLLFTFAGNRCSFPGCDAALAEPATHADDAVVLANIAHIVAHSDDGPRGDKNFPKDDRDKYDNLLLLCAHHHTLVDGQPNSYTCDDLRKWKSDHQTWVHERIFAKMDDIHFSELEVVCRAIASSTPIKSTAAIAVPLRNKIESNRLSDEAESFLKIGLTRAPLVADYLEAMAGLDSEFPNRLRAGFVQKFEELASEGASTDGIFIGLVSWSSTSLSNTVDPLTRVSVGVAVLAHLFELCEVFSP